MNIDNSPVALKVLSVCHDPPLGTSIGLPSSRIFIYGWISKIYCQIIKESWYFHLNFLLQPYRTKNKEMRAKNNSNIIQKQYICVTYR
jgi:hypothetical protein